MQPADKVVKRLIDQIVSQESGYQYLKMEPGVYMSTFLGVLNDRCPHDDNFHTGMDVTLIVNNLGGTSYIELYLMANSAVKYLSKTFLIFSNTKHFGFILLVQCHVYYTQLINSR